MRQVLLLRGINIGKRRVPMPALRELLTGAGFGDVQTYVQSGNVVLDSKLAADKLASNSAKLIAGEFGFDVPVVVRSHNDLARVVNYNPLADVAANPKRYQVTFLERKLDSSAASKLKSLAVEPEAIAIKDLEIYTWHDAGVARSKLWSAVASKGLGVTATARNWTTVCTLLGMSAG
jgi:uncharacterized protein (DUF1697 family)